MKANEKLEIKKKPFEIYYTRKNNNAKKTCRYYCIYSSIFLYAWPSTSYTEKKG